MGRIASLVVVGIVAACTACPMGKPPELQCEPSHEVDVTGYDIDPRFDDDDRVVIAESMARWTRATGGRLQWREHGTDLFFVRVESARNLPGYSAAYAHVVGLYYPLYGVHVIYLVRPAIYTRAMLGAVVTHELGHNLALAHAPDESPSCMTRLVSDDCLESGEVPRLDRVTYCGRHACNCE